MLLQVKDFKYLVVLFIREEKMEFEVDRWVDAAVMCSTAKLLIYLWVVVEVACLAHLHDS